MRNCNACDRTLPETAFQRMGKRGRGATCSVCVNDRRRCAKPLPVIERDPVQIALNNAACLWFGPVRPMPRYAV